MRDSSAPDRSDLRLSIETATLHGLSWLVVGNSVGLLLATLLLLPGLGALLAPLTYGRWMPVHLNLQLYGWSALPLVALLFRIYLPARAGRWPVLAVGIWSGSLLFATVSWLSGHSSGKLFLEWTGPARLLLAANLFCLALVLCVPLVRQTARRIAPVRSFSERCSLTAKWVLLLGLFGVPGVLYWAADPTLYPPINPSSGGPTGGSLLGSTLGIVAVVLLLPFACGLRPRGGFKVLLLPAVALLAHFAWFALMDHGNHSHHEPMQFVSLASLAIWFPLLTRYLRRFDWPESCRLWLPALGGWGALLLLTAIPTFLPGVLERWKFTNALVGHAHLAMAGFVTSLLVVMLVVLNRDTALGRLFAAKLSFSLWHAGSLVHVVSLLVLGSLEAADPGLVFRATPVVETFYLVRWLAGGTMLAASGLWLRSGLRCRSGADVERPAAVEELYHAA